MKRGTVLYKGVKAGTVWQDEQGYGFQYDQTYLSEEFAKAISLTLPMVSEPYLSNTMIPFFDGLIPEGWLLDITAKNWKLDVRDRMSLLLVACHDCIGAVSIEEEIVNV